MFQQINFVAIIYTELLISWMIYYYWIDLVAVTKFWVSIHITIVVLTESVA